MALKQKVMGLAALLIPLLALAVFLGMAPPRAQASPNGCPYGEIYAPCYPTGAGWCQSGGGTCFGNGYGGGIYTFCKSESGGFAGPGTCEDGCVTCKYGG